MNYQLFEYIIIYYNVLVGYSQAKLQTNQDSKIPKLQRGIANYTIPKILLFREQILQ